MSIVGGWLVTSERRRFNVWCNRGTRFTIIDGAAVPRSYEGNTPLPTDVLMTIGGLDVERMPTPGDYVIKALRLKVSESGARS